MARRDDRPRIALGADMLRNPVTIVAAVVLAIAVLVGVPLAVASQPAYFGRYHALVRNLDELKDSNHRDLACNDCHTDSRGPVAYRAALTADFYAGLFGKQQTPRFVKFDKPRNESCLACHETDWSMEASRTAKVPHPAHSRVVNETRECVTCHKWTAHEEAYMEKHKTMPFSGVCAAYGCHVGTKAADECDSCHHSLRKGGAPWKTEHPRVVQAKGANGCLETCHDVDQCRKCHTTGQRPAFSGLATETGMKAIEALHVKPTWVRQHGAEALKDRSKCMKCHVSDGECRSCHAQRPASHGPESTWIGTHSKVAKDERRCLTCHRKPWCEDCHRQFKEMR